MSKNCLSHKITPPPHPCSCQRAQELTKEYWYFGPGTVVQKEFSSAHDPIPVQYCCNVSMVLCHTLPFLPKSDVVCRICCFPNLINVVLPLCQPVSPQMHILLMVTVTLTSVGAASSYRQFQLDSSHSLCCIFEVWGTETLTGMLCLQQPWNPPQWLLLVAVDGFCAAPGGRAKEGNLFQGW